MQRWIPILAVIFAVQLLLAGALTLRTDAVSASVPSAPLITTASKDVDRIVIDGQAGKHGNSVELIKKDGKWLLHSYFDAPANDSKVNELLGKLTDLKRGLPIATSKSALHRFKVSDDTYQRRLTLSGNGKTLATIYFGESPGVHKTDARTSKDHAVFAVDLPVYQVPSDAQNWFNANLLQHPTEQLAEVDISGKGLTDVTLRHVVVKPDSSAKQNATQGAENKPAAQPVATWQVDNLGTGKQLDMAHVNELVNAINDVRVTAVLGRDVKPEWQMDHPLLQLTLKDDHGQPRTWTLAKSSSGDEDVLKSSAYPWYFSIAPNTAKTLLDNSNDHTLIASVHNEKHGSDKSKALAADTHKKSGSAG